MRKTIWTAVGGAVAMVALWLVTAAAPNPAQGHFPAITIGGLTNVYTDLGSALLRNGVPVGGGGSVASLGWVDVTQAPFNATGDGITDDTAAIQAAINSITNNGGTVYFPKGKYNIAGPFQTVTGADNAAKVQLVLPVRSVVTDKMILIRLLGESPPAPNVNWSTDHQPLYNGGSIIISTNTTGVNYDTIIGNSGPSGLFPVNAMHIWVENLTFRTIPACPFTPLNLSQVGQVTVRNVLVDTGVDLGSTSQPPGGGDNAGVAMPTVNNWAVSVIDNVDVVGYINGFDLGEHCDAQNIRAWQCLVAFRLRGGVFPLHVGKSIATACQVGIYATAAQTVFWDNYEVEHTTQAGGRAWMNTTDDIHDNGGYLTGKLYYGAALTGSGRVHTFTTTAASSLDIQDLFSNYSPVMTTSDNLPPAVEGSLTHAGTLTLNFTKNVTFSSISLTGDITLATSNLAAGHVYELFITHTSTNDTPTFPSWGSFLSGAPTYLTGGKTSVLRLRSRGATDANVVAEWAEAQ